ncbi:MAG: bifunctional 4-hydroxy-2-oxoglutarate aldolase/2-dehydro-3-deoxy-phosphogluconate aldolase [Gammaproteobacteria bacterium]
MNARQILALGPVVPVVTLQSANDAAALAEALLAGAIQVIEVTLRTPAALDCIRRIRREVPDIVVGAGTVVTDRQLGEAADSGAQFIVSPGATPSLLDAARRAGLPFVPGASTVSQSMHLSDEGLDCQKFFPASACGGTAFLAAVSSVLPNISYCPTGGIDAGNASDYLRLPNVAAVGGSWLAPAGTIERKDWAGVERLAREATSLSDNEAS